MDAPPAADTQPGADAPAVPDAGQRLRRAASRLFHTRGYEAVGIAELCAAADARKGSFYHYYPSKQALALAVIEHDRRRVREYLRRHAFDPTIPPLDRLDRYGHVLADGARRVAGGPVTGCRFGTLAMEMSTRDPVLRDALDRVFLELRDDLAATIREAIERGDVPDGDATELADAVIALMEGFELMSKIRDDPDLTRRLGPAARALLGAA
jgi:TetR/AcrR family transcriptional regulator, transcriptional repressor for nem operon